MLPGISVVRAQEIKLNISVQNPFDNLDLLGNENQSVENRFPVAEQIENGSFYAARKARVKQHYLSFKAGSQLQFEKRITAKQEVEENAFINESFPRQRKKEKFHWKPALVQSGIFLGIQHGFRMTQRRTRRELDGPFFRDWAQSVKNLRGWRDGDNMFINYVAHPLQGGFTGRIFINNSDKAKRQEFGKSAGYWESRMKAMAWSAFWSTQFELGPISEASIGNVGLRQDMLHKMTYVDLVITPLVGTGVVVGEDALDKYVLKNWLERKSGGRVTNKIKIWRSLLTPTLSLSNLLRRKPPWERDNR